MATCGFEGNSDTYGLGIRLGLYIQWFATFLAGTLAPDEAEGWMDINFGFTISTFIALIYIIATRGSTLETGSVYAVEAWILLMLCIASTLGQITASIGADRTKRQASELWGDVRATILAGVNVYALWFYSTGMYRMVHTSHDQSIFLFRRVDLFGGFRVAALVIHSLFIFIFSLVSIDMAFYWVLGRSLGLVVKVGKEDPIWNRPTEGPTTGRSQGDTVRSAIVYLIILIWCCVMIEVTIKYNRIQGVHNVNSTGQLILLIVGAVGLFQFLSKLGKSEDEIDGASQPTVDHEALKEEEAKGRNEDDMAVPQLAEGGLRKRGHEVV